MKLPRWSCPTVQDSAPISAFLEPTALSSSVRCKHANIVNTQTLCPFRPSSREKVYLQKSHIRPKLRQTTIKSTTKLADSFGNSKVHENILLPCNTSFDPSILKMQFGKLVDVQTS